MVACFWLNGARVDIEYGAAEAITVDNGDIYVAGHFTTGGFNVGSCYWKNGVKTNLTTNRDSQAFGIAVKNNGDGYTGGWFMNNHHYVLPCFWKNFHSTLYCLQKSPRLQRPPLRVY